MEFSNYNSKGPGNDEARLNYLSLLAYRYPNRRSVVTEIINLQAILNLPKGTEHFMSDPHGEYDAFRHIINNCSGVIKEKVDQVLGESLTSAEQAQFCTLIYYPKEKLSQLKAEGGVSELWYKNTLEKLIALAQFLTSKYTRSKVRKAMPKEYAYILDELLHAQQDEDNNRQRYHKRIIDSIIDTGSCDDFIYSLCALIKRLAVDRIHIIGDFFDRGSHADRILDLLSDYHSIDIQWGNHDILWMGAGCGSLICIAGVIRSSIRYKTLEILESGYGISLRALAMFAEKTYKKDDGVEPLMKAANVLLFKLEGQLIARHPEFDMRGRLLLDKVDIKNKTVEIDGKNYEMNTVDFPTVDPKDPYKLTDEENQIMQGLYNAFVNSERLRRHIDFLYSKGSMYKCCNGNLLFHGCIPLDKNGNMDPMNCDGKLLQGKPYIEFCDMKARDAWNEGDENSLDWMWYLWCGLKSPLSGRVVKTFERSYLTDKTTWKEPRNPYFTYYGDERYALMILHEFGLYSDRSHIINGHTPVHVSNGESPIRANGRVLVIDGGFCKAYQKTTGIAGYTLIFNSHGMRIKAHQPFVSLETALNENADMDSDTNVVETESKRVMVADIDDGDSIRRMIADLRELLDAYREGRIQESK